MSIAVQGQAVAARSFTMLIDQDFARRHMIVEGEPGEGSASAEETGPPLWVAMETPAAAIWNCQTRLGAQREVVVKPAEVIAARIDVLYAAAMADREVAAEADAAQAVDVERLIAAADRNLLTTAGKGPVMQLVDALLYRALALGASDVHVQPLEDRALVRYRIDGILHTWRALSPGVAQAATSRLKVMARMDIAERRLAQDGRATVTIGGSGERDGGRRGRSIDLRLSTLPTSHGERVVVRLLESSASRPLSTFADLGMPPDVERTFLERAGRAGGIILVTGPTGSGKTTTLYTTLRWLSGQRHASGSSGCPINIMTVEDPIEYALAIEGVTISQTQVNTRKGVTFATGLRHILRQDPDVIMVGEIRDEETARLALQASLTGHLVFSTLHTNDATTAVTRLLDLGMEPYLVADSLSCVLAQRLARRVHGACRGRGCEACLNSGFSGRIGLFELLAMTDRLRESIARRAAAAELLTEGVRGGMRRLVEEGRRLTEEGLTTWEEVRRVAFGPEASVSEATPSIDRSVESRARLSEVTAP